VTDSRTPEEKTQQLLANIEEDSKRVRLIRVAGIEKDFEVYHLCDVCDELKDGISIKAEHSDPWISANICYACMNLHLRLWLELPEDVRR